MQGQSHQAENFPSFQRQYWKLEIHLVAGLFACILYFSSLSSVERSVNPLVFPRLLPEEWNLHIISHGFLSPTSITTFSRLQWKKQYAPPQVHSCSRYRDNRLQWQWSRFLKMNARWRYHPHTRLFRLACWTEITTCSFNEPGLLLYKSTFGNPRTIKNGILLM